MRCSHFKLAGAGMCAFVLVTRGGVNIKYNQALSFYLSKLRCVILGKIYCTVYECVVYKSKSIWQWLCEYGLGPYFLNSPQLPNLPSPVH